MTEMIPWEQVRAEALESGQVTQDALTRAQIEQDAHVAGYRLAELRGKAGMTQTQLAEEMRVSQARVSARERGDVDSLTVASVRAYITALGARSGSSPPWTTPTSPFGYRAIHTPPLPDFGLRLRGSLPSSGGGGVVTFNRERRW
jgi:DNA-binding transcriptional regulator YiaG